MESHCLPTSQCTCQYESQEDLPGDSDRDHVVCQNPHPGHKRLSDSPISTISNVRIMSESSDVVIVACMALSESIDIIVACMALSESIDVVIVACMALSESSDVVIVVCMVKSESIDVVIVACMAMSESIDVVIVACMALSESIDIIAACMVFYACKCNIRLPISAHGLRE